jgi:endonuclease/exonuclease/phosphatase family metal-dependent hydrolase
VVSACGPPTVDDDGLAGDVAGGVAGQELNGALLADAYIHPEWYPGTPASVLARAWRLPAVVQRVADLDADVICLQEVEPGLFQALEARLRALGCAGQYAQKGGSRPDGCATFVNDTALGLRDWRPLPYADGRGPKPPSGHVALIVVLETEDRVLGIANTHLKWDPPGTPVEEHWSYRQIRQLLDEQQTFDPPCHAWVVCGDFNATPGSDVVGTLQQAGWVDAYHPLDHLCTCNANRQAKRIDNLLHTRNLESRPVVLSAIDDQTPLPSAQEPSDHLAIAAQFDWIGSR